MNITPEQKNAVSSWIAAGDNLSAVQKKLREEFQLSMTYMDVRFLVDDLNLTLRDTATKAEAPDLAKATPPPPAKSSAKPATEKKGLLDRAKEKLGIGNNLAAETNTGDDNATDNLDAPADELDDAAPSAVQVEVDGVTLIPGAIASGKVTFSDGVSGKWIVDQYGRPGFTEISKPGYRPSAEDAQAFMQELDEALRQKGF